MLSVPFYRQERDFKRMGAPLKRDTMANWVIRCAEYWLKPLYDRMHKQLLKCDVIMSDETTWQVLREEGRKHPANHTYGFIGVEVVKVLPLYCMNILEPVQGITLRIPFRIARFHVSDAYMGTRRWKVLPVVYVSVI